MLSLHNLLIRTTAQTLCLGLLLGVATTGRAADAGAPLTLHFDGVEYFHRWSKDDQNEFTPRAETDLQKWNDMITINVHDNVTDGDKLATVAIAVLANYQKAGKILRTDSKPRTGAKEAEHLCVAILGAPGVLEAVFARIMMHDGAGTIVVYSHRAYGDDPATVLGEWLQKNGPGLESTLMSWDGIPSRAALDKLPQSRD